MSTVKGHTVTNSHYINGSWVEGGSYFDVFSPIDGEHLAKMPAGSAADVGEAISSAQKAFPAWAKLGAKGRLPYLQRFALEIGKRKNAFCEVESADAGILLSRLRHGIVPRSMLNITWFAEAALNLHEKIIETEQAKHYIRYDPSGVCAIINPFFQIS